MRNAERGEYIRSPHKKWETKHGQKTAETMAAGPITPVGQII